VLPAELGADRILPRIEMLEQEIPAGVLDVADDARGRVDTAVLPMNSMTRDRRP